MLICIEDTYVYCKQTETHLFSVVMVREFDFYHMVLYNAVLHTLKAGLCWEQSQ